jgi:hypothetical protein
MRWKMRRGLRRMRMMRMLAEGWDKLLWGGMVLGNGSGCQGRRRHDDHWDES